MALRDDIFTAGVVGAGGAGFPTDRKLVAGVKLLIVNAVECEPLLASDRLVVRQSAPDIIAGLQAIAAELAIPRVVIGVKRHNTAEIAALRQAIAAAGAGIEVHEVDNVYPAGDEQILIYDITGQSVPPGGLPLALGIVVSNVTTILNIARARQGQPVTRRWVTVNGAVADPVILDVPIGTTPADLIAAAGGVTIPNPRLMRGGAMMGRPYAMAEAASFGLGKADGGLLVLPEDNPAFWHSNRSTERVLAETRSTCIQCRMCTDLCPRYLIGHQLRPHRVMRSVATGRDGGALLDALLCCECGLCELFACPMGISPRQVQIIVKAQLRQAGATLPDTGAHLDQTEVRPGRAVAQSRLIERLRLGDYPNHLTQWRVFEPDRVVIPTRHGVGRPARPVVATGQTVEVGQVVAEVKPDEVGCLVHASIDGRVAQVSPDQIVIERPGGF